METHESRDTIDTSPSPEESGSVSTGSNGGFRLSSTSALLVLGAIVAVAILAFAAFGEADEPDQVSQADELAALAFLTTDGENATLADFRGEPLVVNFFASWCAPCRAELPEFEAVHQANLDRVRFVGVNHDLDETTWRNFVAETEVTYDTVFQPEAEIFETLNAKGMPSTAFISPDGDVLHLYTGILTESLLQELIDEHLVDA